MEEQEITTRAGQPRRKIWTCASKGGGPQAAPDTTTGVDRADKPGRDRQSDAKSYDIAQIRQDHPRAYLPWTIEEDHRLCQEIFGTHHPCLCGCRRSTSGPMRPPMTIEHASVLHGRKRGAIVSRLKKLHLINEPFQSEEN